jgi:hypothetical protein
MRTLMSLDWGLQKPIVIGSGSRGSPKNNGPFPKRAEAARRRPIPVMTQVSGRSFSLKRSEKNKNHVAGKSANEA